MGTALHMKIHVLSFLCPLSKERIALLFMSLLLSGYEQKRHCIASLRSSSESYIDTFLPQLKYILNFSPLFHCFRWIHLLHSCVKQEGNNLCLLFYFFHSYMSKNLPVIRKRIICSFSLIICEPFREKYSHVFVVQTVYFRFKIYAILSRWFIWFLI